MKKGFSLNAAKEFFNILLTRKFVGAFGNRDHVQLKAFFHDKKDDSDTSNKDIFETSKNQKLVKDTIQNLIVHQELPDTATNLIINTPRTSCIYFLPNIHKPNNPGRPIVSVCSCPTELISSYLNRIMTPIVKSLPSYIKDSTHALQIFRDFNFSGQDKLIFTMDITTLYTVIPNSEGLQHLNTFSINALSKNLARKRSSALPN